MTLAERLVAVHRALGAAGVPHAFGGAIALAFWTETPRATRDLDLNLFVPPVEAEMVRRALPRGVIWSAETDVAIARDGQARVLWEGTPLDLFFAYAPLHEAAAGEVRSVPFLGQTIPVLGPSVLAAFKVAFDRTRDWADLEDMARAGTLDVDAVWALIAPVIGVDDPRLARLAEAHDRGTGHPG